MSLNITPSTSQERKQLFLEVFLNLTDKVSKVSDNSIVSAMGGGIAKVSGKAEKDIILALSQLFPDTAYGDQLDQVAANFGLPGRFGALGSSTYIRVIADPGTVYDSSVHFFKSTDGITFELEEDFTMNAFGFDYRKVRSIEVGVKSNVDPLSISIVNPIPSGHIAVINEIKADGGRDEEDDETLRKRIKDGANILARGTISMLEQIFINENPNVLRVYHLGIGNTGKICLGIATQNGANLSGGELDSLLLAAQPYFSLTEHTPIGPIFSGVELKNIEYFNLDISFRVDLDPSADPDEIRKSIQVAISKYLDFRFWDSYKQKIEWDNLLEIVKNTKGVKYVLDQYFSPRADIGLPFDKLPRLRGFLMLDLAGTVISNFSGTLSPIYYPNEADFEFQETLLNI